MVNESSTASTPTVKKKLKMRFAGGVVKHLGSQLYSGVVTSIAELVANAWDADADKVEITIPLETDIHPFVDKIVVKDNGWGMSFAECQDSYLIIARNKRALDGETSRNGRPLMGRKGLGKFACFGIAKQVEVRTVNENGELTQFKMDYDDIESKGDFQEYEPGVIEDGLNTNEPKGTEVILRGLTLKRQINQQNFLKNLSRSFLLPVISSTFKILVNGEELKRTEEDLEFIFPNEDDEEKKIKIENGYAIETIAGLGDVKWRIGFNELPIKVEGIRGVSVIAHNKQIQPPWLFGLDKGVRGQIGQQYITGEVIADFIDDGEDLVTTDRAGLLWEKSPAKELQDWAQDKLIQLLGRWNDKRIIKRFQEVEQSENYIQRIQKFQASEKSEIEKAVKAITSAVDTKSRITNLVDIILNAWENKHFVELIQRINALSPEVRAEMIFVLEEFKVLDAINIAQVVRVRLEVIDKFRELIKNKVREFDIQTHLESYPWLISWDMDKVEPKETLKDILLAHFHADSTDSQAQTIPDFFCLGDGIRDFVIEIKKAGVGIDKGDLIQIAGYVDFLRAKQNQNTSSQDHRIIVGFIIGDHLVSGLEGEAQRLERDDIHVRTWDKLLEIADYNHREYFNIVKKRAPKEDPRMKTLESFDLELKRRQKDEDFKKIIDKK